MATANVGTVLALSATDIKPLLAFFSIGRLGYIITALARMSHIESSQFSNSWLARFDCRYLTPAFEVRCALRVK